MAKEILLYGDLWGYSAAEAVTLLNEARNSDVTIRFLSDGGEIRAGWAILGKLKELKGRKVFKNDGEANSMAAFAFMYNDNNEALDVASFGLHRAGYPSIYESSEFFTDNDRKELTEKNSKLRAAMEARLDIPAFERIAKCTLDEFFSLDDRREVCLTASEALECKLIDRITTITPEIRTNIEVESERIYAKFSPHKIAARTEPTIPTTMTADEIKSKYPDAYKAIYAKGKAKGIEVELDRAGSILAYIDADQKGVIEAHKSGKPLTETMRSEFALKATAKSAVATLEDESETNITVKAEKITPGAASAKTAAAEKAKAEFDKKMDEQHYQMYGHYPKSRKNAA